LRALVGLKVACDVDDARRRQGHFP